MSSPHKITFMLNNGQRSAIKSPEGINENWLRDATHALVAGNPVIVKSKDADISVMPGEVCSIIVHHTAYET